MEATTTLAYIPYARARAKVIHTYTTKLSGRNAQVQADCYRIVISKSGIIWGHLEGYIFKTFWPTARPGKS